jgi:hypothetical protein
LKALITTPTKRFVMKKAPKIIKRMKNILTIGELLKIGTASGPPLLTMEYIIGAQLQV